MINTTYVYFIHKGDNIPCYIGKTVNPQDRLKNHKAKNKQYLHLEILDEVPSSEWKFWEEWYIELFISWGFTLENKTLKGRGPGHRPCTWGDKISQTLIGKTPNWSESEVELRKTRLKGKQFVLGYKYTKLQKDSITEGRRIIYYQYDLNNNFIKEWFSTKTEISSHFGKDKSNLTHHLKGRQKSAFGFIWKTQK